MQGSLDMIKRLIGWALPLCLFCCGCTRSVYNQETRFHNDGRAKPKVTLVPAFDRSNAKIGWNLSEEFTDHLRQRLLKLNQLYLNTPEEVNAITAELTPEHNPFSSEPNWIYDTFSPCEFVVFTEIVEHEIRAKPPSSNFFDKLTPSKELTLTMRVRIFDLRKDHNCVILEELVSNNYSITSALGLSEKSADYWQKITFAVSPLGLAHAKLSKEVAKRIEDYILLAQSH